jgi:hypothetical protein
MLFSKTAAIFKKRLELMRVVARRGESGIDGGLD